jgi:type I restriction enzyme S subunit
MVLSDLPKGRALAKCYYVESDDRYAVNQRVCRLKPNRIDGKFLYYTLNRHPNLLAFDDGLSQTHLSKSGVIECPLRVPSEKEEQQKIAECLSSVDELMAAESRKVDALKTHKKGLMQQLFPREGETQPRLRFPEFQDAGEWEATTVGGLVEAGCLSPPKDGNHGNIHPKSSDYVAEGIPFIMASDLNGGVIDIETCHFISKEQADTLQKGFAKEGDVLLSHKGTVGEVAVVRKINTPYLMLTPQVTYYRVKDQNKLSNEFLAQLFVSDAFQSNLVEVSGGGTRAYIGITEQGKLRLQVPEDAEEQQHIADCLNSLDALITAQTQKLDALKTHKKALMQQLFPSSEEIES